MLNKDL